MIKQTYRNPLNYTYSKAHSGSHYLIDGEESYCNYGQLCESIAKAYRGLYTGNNPTTPYWEGSDIEEISASVKSRRASLGRSFGDTNNPNEAIRYFFKQVKSHVFIYVILNLKTQMVTEYIMTKSEFGRMINHSIYRRYSPSSKNHKIELRLRTDSKAFIAWMDAQCAY